MFVITSAVQNHPIVTFLVSEVLLGYLGYRIVRWLNAKSAQPTVPPLTTASLTVPQGKILQGQGEYVVFKPGEKVDEETYKKVHAVFNKYLPQVALKAGLSAGVCENRYEAIKREVKIIDPKLEIAFIPKTLYELIYIRKCIEEDLEHDKICPGLSRCLTNTPVDLIMKHYSDFQGAQHLCERRTNSKCWHMFSPDDDSEGQNNHPNVQNLAWRINALIVQTLNPKADGFTYDELSRFCDKEMLFFQGLFDSRARDLNTDQGVFGPTAHFSSSRGYGDLIRPMGIQSDTDKSMIKRALKLDCSDLARKNFFLYRGGNFKDDSVTKEDPKTKAKTPFSLSYGTGLFAGCLFDPAATAFHYMKASENAYAIAVPFSEYSTSPFYIPPTNTVVQLSSSGETFHARTKVWKGYVPYLSIPGVLQRSKDANSLLSSALSQDELIKRFNACKSRAINLR